LKQQVYFLFRLAVYYLLFFAFWRLLFILFNSAHQQAYTFYEASGAFLHGARMDFSVVSYLLIIPVALLFLFPWKPAVCLYRHQMVFHRLIILVLTVLLTANVIVFHFWGSLLNYRALTYLNDPKQTLHSLSTLQALGAFLFLSLMVILAWFILRKTCRVIVKETGFPVVRQVLLIVIVSFVLVSGIRGGWQMLPMNESLVAYSKNNFLNQSALNPAWHLVYEIRTAGLTHSNPFNKMENAEAAEIVRELFENGKDTFPEILNKARPNIVLIILESHTADLVGEMGGEENVSPFLDSLIRNGLLFSNVHSSGSRTDQGIVSLLNGWPATPYHSIMRSADKSSRLPSLVKDLRSQGYYTSFYYGGESNFSNMNTYLSGQLFEKQIEKPEFDAKTPRGKWGVYDEFVFSKQLADMKEQEGLFFSVILTLSNHEPFDIPRKPRFMGHSEADKFKSAAAYTDDCLREYFNMAKNERWYDSTLFILVADHGHRLPYYKDEVFPDTKRIPLLFYGNVLKAEFRGVKNEKLGGHHDLPATLLPQLNLGPDTYAWSKNLLNPFVKDFAYYQIEYVMGWKEPVDYFVYSYPKNDLLVDSIHTELRRDTLIRRGHAFIQKLYGEYLDY
jgi:phosphoglycerol transferase MdoB-like AlkP superfamily enzyme